MSGGTHHPIPEFRDADHFWGPGLNQVVNGSHEIIRPKPRRWVQPVFTFFFFFVKTFLPPFLLFFFSLNKKREIFLFSRKKKGYDFGLFPPSFLFYQLRRCVVVSFISTPSNYLTKWEKRKEEEEGKKNNYTRIKRNIKPVVVCRSSFSYC